MPVNSNVRAHVNRLLRISILLAAAGATEGTVFAVLNRNLTAGVYPVDSDSIGLPLIASASVLVLFSTLAAAGLLCVGRSRWMTRLGIISLILAGLLALLFGITWADTDHWPIAASFGVLALALPLLCGRVTRLPALGGSS
jgi:hypothetical protein